MVLALYLIMFCGWLVPQHRILRMYCFMQSFGIFVTLNTRRKTLQEKIWRSSQMKLRWFWLGNINPSNCYHLCFFRQHSFVCYQLSGLCEEPDSYNPSFSPPFNQNCAGLRCAEYYLCRDTFICWKDEFSGSFSTIGRGPRNSRALSHESRIQAV